MGLDAFFDKSFAAHIDLAAIPADERARYIADWSRPGALTAMLNWYRASHIVVPAADMTVPVPEWVLGAFPGIRIPTLVVWGMRDKALLPVQLDGLDSLVDDLAIVRLPGAGHFAPWEAGGDVASALAPFLAGMGAATARRA
jgi:pimeloyl-ACP methyl ester carboxylesterase